MKHFRLMAAVVLACFFFASVAQAFAPTDFVYFPGYVSYRVALKTFSPASMAQAGDLLQGGKLVEAQPLFQAQNQKHPEDLTSWIGFLQAARGHRDQLLPQYEKEAKASPTAANEFKLGLLAFYMYGENYMKLSQPPTLPNLAREHLKFGLLAGPDYPLDGQQRDELGRQGMGLVQPPKEARQGHALFYTVFTPADASPKTWC